jgi:hypothetical protein
MCFECLCDTDNNISVLYAAGATIWSLNAGTSELTGKSILVSSRWRTIAYLMFSTLHSQRAATGAIFMGHAPKRS